LRDHPLGCYPLLFFDVETNDTARGNMKSIKSNYRDLWVIVMGIGAQG